MNTSPIVSLLLILILVTTSGCADFLPPPATPTPLPSGTPSPSATPTLTPTWTATPTLTPPPTATPTITPVLEGGLNAPPADAMEEINLDRVAEVARFGRGEVHDMLISGRFLLAATSLGIWVYDAANLDLLALLPSGPVNALAGDGLHRFWAGGIEISAWNFDGAQWQEEGPRIPVTGKVLALAYSEQKGLLSLVQPPEASARLQGPETRVVNGQKRELSGARFSPSGGLLAGWDTSGNLGVWDQEGQPLFQISGIAQPIPDVTFSPSETLLAVALVDQSADFENSNRVDFYRVPDGQLLSSLTVGEPAEGLRDQITSLAWAPDGLHFAAGFSGGDIHYHVTNELSAASNPPQRFLPGQEMPAALRFDESGSQLCAGTIECWDTAEGGLIASAPHHTPPALDLVLSPDGGMVALARKGFVELLALPSGAPIRNISADGARVHSLAFSPTGDRLAGACSDGLGRIWRTADGTLLGVSATPGEAQWAIAWSPNGNYILTGGENGRVELYDIPWNHINYSIREPYAAVRLTFSPIGLLYGVLTSSGVRIRDIGGVLTRQVAGVGLEDVTFSPDGGSLAIAGREILQVADVGANRDRYSQYDPRRGSPTAVAYSANGAFLAVGRGDGTLDILWAADGTLLRTLSGHTGRITRLAFTRDTRLLVSTGEDGTTRLWGVVPAE